MTDVERLIAVQELQMLQAKRVRALDAQDWESYRACHADDFISHTMGNPIHGRDAALKMLIAMLDGVTSVHHVFSPEFRFASDVEASGIWVLADRLWWREGDAPHWMRGWGHYHDSYRKLDGRWLFTSRRIERLRVERSEGSALFAGA